MCELQNEILAAGLWILIIKERERMREHGTELQKSHIHQLTMRLQTQLIFYKNYVHCINTKRELDDFRKESRTVKDSDQPQT